MKHTRRLFLFLFLALALCKYTAVGNIRAEEPFADRLSSFRQIVYSSRNGLPGEGATAIACTPDGMIWIGTYAGLCRYDEHAIQMMGSFDSVRNVNTLYTDADGRLWIGTNDNGLSILEGDRIVRVIDPSSGLPSWSVRGVIHSSDGYCYVSTVGGMQVLSLRDDLAPVCTLPEILYTCSLSADSSGLVAAVTNSGELFLLREGQILSSCRMPDGQSPFSSCWFDSDNRLLAGTWDNQILTFDVSECTFEETGSLLSAGELRHINDMVRLETGELLIAADNGIGLFDTAGQITQIDTGEFRNQIGSILSDHRGSLWFASSRLGLLRMVSPAISSMLDMPSSGEVNAVPDFRNIYADAGMTGKTVNAIIRWNDLYYFGTDQGLDAVNPDNTQQVADKLTDQLSGYRIRSLMVDQHNHLWVALYGSGILQVTPDGEQHWYQAPDSIPEKRPRVISELHDGTIVIGGNSGLTFLWDGKVTDTIQGSIILSVTEMSDDRLLAATDGNGILLIDNRQVVRTLTRKDGLTSDVILRSIPDEIGGGVFLVASNGLCYMASDGTIRELHNFPYFNNYDLWVKDDNMLFVTSGAGIFVVDYNELLSGSELHYRLLDYRQGLDGSLMPNSWQYYDSSAGLLLLAGNPGVYMFDPDSFTAETYVYSFSPAAAE